MKSKTGLYIIIISACASLTAIAFYLYKKYAPFTPTKDSIDYSIQIELED
jgi:uncharacterized protein YqjF (DUF2071 family)